MWWRKSLNRQGNVLLATLDEIRVP